MNKKIRIMHVNGRLDTGGIEEVIYTTAKYNNNEKYELAFIVYREKEGYTSKIEEMGFPIFALDLEKALLDLRVLPKIVNIFKSYRPHIVHFYQGSMIGRVAAKIAGIPIIIRNEMDLNYNRHGLRRKLSVLAKNSLNPLADKLIACSSAVKDFWWKSNNDKCAVIHIPFDLSKFPSVEFNSKRKFFKNGKYPVIGTVSRINHEKGHKYLIQAMPKIIEAFPSVRLKIVGTGPLLKDMKGLAESMALSSSIEFTGFVQDLFQELSRMDVFILPSLTEGFPVSILEAMAAELPIAASAVGGIPEMVEHGNTGLLFAPKNPDSISDAIVGMLSDNRRLWEMGKNGKQKVMAEFSPEVYVRKLDDLYQDLLQKKLVSDRNRYQQ
jgi:glycosyltransferase involved in cell wall biosynthesis